MQLISGGGSSASDPAAGAPEPGPQQEAVPGPATRLFVIANRGISNLIQDLILVSRSHFTAQPAFFHSFQQ